MTSDPGFRRAYILAGGKGSRLRPVVADRPKCLAPINGKPFLHFQLDYLTHQGVQEVVICGGYLASMIQDEVGIAFKNLTISYVVEDIPLGTGGALWNGISQTAPDGDFVVLNGDTMFTAPLRKLVEELEKSGADFAVGLSLQNDSSRYGAVELDADGFVESIATNTVGKAPFPVNSGVWLCSPSVFGLSEVIPEPPYSLESIINEGIARGITRVKGVVSDSTFIDIGIPEDYFRAVTLDIFRPEVL
jgi:D-glycero-alpha-D-manno-heptose 1-phosphate guanylyltransferase